jgi:hypothetical protein
MNRFCSVIFVAVFGLAPSGIEGQAVRQAQTAIEQFQKLQEELRSAHADHDAAAYFRSSQRMRDFLNGSPDSVLQVMSAEAFAGKWQEALQSFREFVRLGQSNEETLQAKQFAVIRADPNFVSVHSDMVANSAPVSLSTRVFSLAEPALIPEDIDYDANSALFYVTSILKKEVLAVDMTGRARRFATAPDQWPMLAIKVDSRRRLLWATEVAMDGFVLSPPGDWGRSAIVIYDLTSGKLLHRIEGPPHAALGDMTLTASGDAVVSDGDNGGVYRVGRETQKIERLDGGDFISPQTPAMLPDGEHLFVPDYVRGIGILDLKSKRVSWIPMEDRYALSGIDGLYLSGRTLIATQNGTSPERVVRFALDASLTRIVSESIIERATSTLGDPTHGVIVNGRFYYIANSGWNTLDEHGNHKAGTTMSVASIMRTDL